MSNNTLLPSSSPFADPSAWPQPQCETIAKSSASASSSTNTNPYQLDVNGHFLAYVVQGSPNKTKGLIRVLHRSSPARALIRAHVDTTVQQVVFVPNATDVLGTIGYDPSTQRSKLVIWRIFVVNEEIQVEALLEIPAPGMEFQRLVWHPLTPNQFWIVLLLQNGSSSAQWIDTTRIQSSSGNAVAQWHSETHSVSYTHLTLPTKD